MGNAFGGIQEDKFCKTEKCLDEQLNLKTLTKQNGMQFSTPDIDNDYYCRLAQIKVLNSFCNFKDLGRLVQTGK